MKQINTLIATLVAFYLAVTAFAQSPAGTSTELKHGTLLTERLNSVVLRDNLVGLSTDRAVKVYLPPGYATSGKAYPVVYYCHSIFQNPDQLLENGTIALLERAFANKMVGEFIFVLADYSSATTGSLYENSPTTGRWLDYTTQELVPFIDSKYRTIRQRESRAVVGDFMGGRGALVLAMMHADLFSVAYAMHPVATGMGYLPWTETPIDWKKIYAAKSAQDFTQGYPIFLAINQAFLPNPKRPPFYCDYFLENENGKRTLNLANMRKAKATFLLDHMLETYSANLRSMRGLAFDWARFDSNQDHVISAREFSRMLDDEGVEHEAEEYRGTPWNRNWAEDGRFYARVLPFLANHLVFEK